MSHRSIYPTVALPTLLDAQSLISFCVRLLRSFPHVSLASVVNHLAGLSASSSLHLFYLLYCPSLLAQYPAFFAVWDTLSERLTVNSYPAYFQPVPRLLVGLTVNSFPASYWYILQ